MPNSALYSLGGGEPRGNGLAALAVLAVLAVLPGPVTGAADDEDEEDEDIVFISRKWVASVVT